MTKTPEPRICIWCQNEIEHSFDLPLCVPCLVKIHHVTTDRNFDTNKILQDYLKEKVGPAGQPKEPEPPKKKKK